MSPRFMHVLRKADDEAQSMDVVVRRFWTGASHDRVARRALPSGECRVVDLSRWAGDVASGRRRLPAAPRRA